MKTKGKAIAGVVAAIMLVSVLAVTVPIAGAESRGDDYNHIVVQQAPQRVLIGQNLQFDGFETPVTITRVSGGDIASIYQPDSENRSYNINWPMSGAYYVNYVKKLITQEYDAQLSVEEPDMPLELKVGTKTVSSIASGTNLIVDTAGMNLFNEDMVDLIVRGPDGQTKYDVKNDQRFTEITVSELKKYGTEGIKTNGWKISDYTFQIKTVSAHACGLDAESTVKMLRIIGREITIEAVRTSAVELETIKIVITGVAGENISVEGDKHVVFRPGIDDTPLNATNWFNDTIDADGIRKYAVSFSDTGTYTIKVTVTDGPQAGKSDTVDIWVLEKEVVFDIPSTVVIGDKVEIKGTTTSGTYVSVYVDDELYSKLENLVIDEEGIFSQEVKTIEVGLDIPGSIRLKGWIDCSRQPGQDRPVRGPDGETAILLERPDLTAQLSIGSIVPEEKFSISGTGVAEVVILCVPPNGGSGKSLLDEGQKGLSPRKASVTDGTFSKKMTVQEDATAGYYDLYVLCIGMDGYWGMTGEADLEAALEKRYSITDLSTGTIRLKTQEEIGEILEDLVDSPGADDLMQKMRLKVERAYVELDTVTGRVAVGDPLVVTGTSNRQQKYVVLVTCKGPEELVPQRVRLSNSTFEARFNTTGAIAGEYRVKADDGDGHSDEVDVKLETPYVALNPIPSATAGEKLVVTGTSNRQDGFAITVTCEGPVNLSAQTKVYRDRFKATFDTTNVTSGTYTVKAEGDGYLDEAVVSIKPRPTPTPTPKPTPTPTPTPPGFEAIFAIAGLLAVAYLVHQRKN